MELGPVELILLIFPGQRVDAKVVAAIRAVAEKGYVTILDLVVVSESPGGDLRLVDFDEDLSDLGLGPIPISGRPLLSEEDLALARDNLPPGGIAVVLVYEESWARTVAGAVRAAGGEVALHVQLPRQVVETAVSAAGSS